MDEADILAYRTKTPVNQYPCAKCGRNRRMELKCIAPCSKCTPSRTLSCSSNPILSFCTFTHVRLLFCIIALLHRTSARRLPNIYWNSTNSIFRIDNTDHVIPVRILDRVNMVCPHYNPDSLYDPSIVEYSSIYSVSRWSYDNCQLTADSERVGFCMLPDKRSIVTLVFREFSPLHPGVLEFKPGHSYYFISTSNGSLSGVENRFGGLCITRNMKLKFEVQIPPKLPDFYADDLEGLGDYDWLKGADDKSKVLGKDVRDASETTPVMYVIHDRHPGDDQYPVQDSQNMDDVEDDEDGGAQSVRSGVLCLILALALIYLQLL